MNCACGPKVHWILGCYFLYYIMHTLLLWGPKTTREAVTEVKPDLYLQCILDEGLPSLLKSLYPQSRVELKELCGMLAHL